jgi:hypothetical protein
MVTLVGDAAIKTRGSGGVTHLARFPFRKRQRMKVNEAEVAETILNRIGAPQGTPGGFDYSPARGAPQFLAHWDAPTLAAAEAEAEAVAKRIGRSWVGDAFTGRSTVTATDTVTGEATEYPCYQATGVIESLDVLVIAMITVETN